MSKELPVACSKETKRAIELVNYQCRFRPNYPSDNTNPKQSYKFDITHIVR